jgi:hypothetical protein
MENEKENKKGLGKGTIYLVVLGVAALVILYLVIRQNWRRFKIEAGYGFAVAVVVIIAALILFVLIRHSINKAKKEREQKKLEKEQERQALIEAGEPVPAIGDGKFDVDDVKEAAEIAGEKISELGGKIGDKFDEQATALVLSGNFANAFTTRKCPSRYRASVKKLSQTNG